MSETLLCMGGPIHGERVPHQSRWLRVPVIDADGFHYRIYERSGDLYLFTDHDDFPPGWRWPSESVIKS